MTTRYRVTDPTYRTITTLSVGRDSFSMICDTMALEVGCNPDEFSFEDETDSANQWTGEELIVHRGAVVGRLIRE